ncbi:MAG: hypothetical protein JW782_06580 [Candidatus Saganbacteria bacterium]|nr:hypothetical protein [Candidatus Saganbacteria bacterium]
MGLDQVSQQGAMLANISSAQGLDQVIRSEMEREIDADNSSKVHQESAVKKAINGQGAQVGTQILASLASKLANKVTSAKLLGDLQEQYGFALEGQAESASDMIDIRHQVSRTSLGNKQGQQNQEAQEGKTEEASPERTAGDIKEYIGAYSQSLVSGGAETKRKLEQIEDRLLKEDGVSLKDIKSLKVQVANSMRGEIARQVKDAYLKQVLAKSKSMEFLVAKRETQGTLHFAERQANLGGFGFGGYKGGLQGTVNEAKNEVGELLRDFVDDALRGEVVKKAVSNEAGQTEKEIAEMLKLGQKVGFDLEQFASNLPKLREDLGLNQVISFEFAGAGQEAGSDQQRQHQYQYTVEEEKEILTDKLRALYMQRAVFGDVRTVLETQFKMIKTKNGLIKLGVKNFDQVEKEASACAKIKLMDMLCEAFEERATYAKLKGEAWKMTERKIKTVLRNLEKLGLELSQTELDQVRDKANEKLFREAEHEYSLIQAAIEANGEIAYYTAKRKKVAGILERLAQESGFQAPGHELELSIREAC